MKNSILLLFITLITSQGLIATESITNESVLTVTCQDITISLDEQGYYELDTSTLIASSDGNIEFTEVTHQYFDCSQEGEVIVTLFAYDAEKNVSECTSVVTVVDDLAPNVSCIDMTVQLDGNGSAITSVEELVGDIFDNCSIGSMIADRSEFSGADLGLNAVTVSVADNSGNASTCISTVAVMDFQAPSAFCQDLTLSLDNTGNATLSAEMIDNGSIDNSDEIFLDLDQLNFDCSQFGSHIVTLTVTDASGNTSTCNATVAVLDDVSPNAICTDINVILNNDGEASILPSDIDNGSSDNCVISFMGISQETFTAGDLGNNLVDLTLFDNAENAGTCIANVHVSAPANNPLIIEAAFALPSEEEIDGPIELDSEEKGNEIHMSLYPNPVRNSTTTVILKNMPIGLKEINLTIFNQSGVAVMKERKLELATKMKLKLDNFQPFLQGIYTVHVNIDGKILTQQLVVG